MWIINGTCYAASYAKRELALSGFSLNYWILTKQLVLIINIIIKLRIIESENAKVESQRRRLPPTLSLAINHSISSNRNELKFNWLDKYIRPRNTKWSV